MHEEMRGENERLAATSPPFSRLRRKLTGGVSRTLAQESTNREVGITETS